MKIAIIADVHGNALALTAVLNDIKTNDITRIINAGDSVSGPLEPKQCAELLMRPDIVSIKGNHDRYLGTADVDSLNDSDRFAYEELGIEQRDWLVSLPSTCQYDSDIYICHGTPASDEEYWTEKVTTSGDVVQPDIDYLESRKDGIGAPVLICAHTHIPRIYRLRTGQILVNPGSVGFPGYKVKKPIEHKIECGFTDAVYAVLFKKDRNWEASLRYVPYDHDLASENSSRNGNKELAGLLKYGWHC